MFNKPLITEDSFVNWIKHTGGVLHTRKYSNISDLDLSKCKRNTIVCLTGYTQVVNQFFTQVIQHFRNRIILVTPETDGFEMKDEYLNHRLLNHWFTWNKPYEHPKLTCLPIGLNADRQLGSLKKYITLALLLGFLYFIPNYLWFVAYLFNCPLNFYICELI